MRAWSPISRASEHIAQGRRRLAGARRPRVVRLRAHAHLARGHRPDERRGAGVRCGRCRRTQPRLHPGEPAAAGGAAASPCAPPADTSRLPGSTGLEVGADAVTLQYAGGALAARLVIGADGAHSAVRSLAGISADSGDYHQQAIVATVATGRPHEHTAWQRFMHDGTLAFLPLADGTSSIVWSADEAPRPGAACAGCGRLRGRPGAAADGALGAMQLKSERQCFALRQAGGAALRRRSAWRSSGMPRMWCTRWPGRA